ncbi:MAG: IclR family transcriptional regulator [Acidobacteriota bacterium]|nr:IclR family transcriptional regulator [Acidobacteriota bacterium]
MSNLKTKSVPALEKAMVVLEGLATSRDGLSLSELTRNLSLPKSSTYGLVVTLERMGYLHRNENTGRYMFGMRLFTLANMAMHGLDLRKQASPYVRKLMKKTRLTVHMAIQEQNEVVIIEKVASPYIPKVGTWVGKRMGIHCTAAGKALISDWSEEDIDRLIHHGLPRYNENTIVSPRKLKEELAQVRKLGYSLDDQEETIGSRCIGAPIINQTGRVVAAVSLAGYREQINKETLHPLIISVKEAAAAISQQLVHTPESGELSLK